MKDAEGFGEIGKKDKMYHENLWKKRKTEIDILKDKVTLDCLFVFIILFDFLIYLKGLSSKPSGDCIVAPNFCFLS